MRVLHLTLKKKWFDLIASGEKKEEYREVKQYWIKRLHNKEFDYVQFRNGYSKDSPIIRVEFICIRLHKGKKEWGAPPEPVFIIKLGKILSGKRRILICTSKQ